MGRVLVAALLGGIIALSMATPAGAAEVFDTDSGYGRAVVTAWSRGYHHVGVVARYSGHARIRFEADCNNGFSRSRSWTDTGPRFRYVQEVPTYTRCTYRAVVRTGGSFIRLGIGGW
jgi:hypothetical protein